MTLLVAGAGWLVAAAAALLPVRRRTFAAAVTAGAVLWSAAAMVGADATRPLVGVCALLVVLLVRRLREDHRRADRLLRAERDAGAGAVAVAAAAERARIARDLHDNLTHLLTGQLLVLRTAEAAVADGDLALASGRLADALRLSRRTLTEARDVVQVLGGSAPDLDLVRSTVREWSAATGVPVELTLPAGTPPLDGGGWGTLLATVREALTNVARHAGADAVRVGVDVRRDRLRLTVQDERAAPGGADAAAPDPVPGGSGTGLQGLRERAALAGGSLSTGPYGPGGWRVVLHLPLATSGPG